MAATDEYIDRFIAEADKHSLRPYQTVGRGVKGELSVRRGDTEAGIPLLRDAIETLHLHRHELLTTAFNCALAEGLAMTGRSDQALTTIDEAIALVERHGDLFRMPELQRVKGAFLSRSPDPDFSLAEGYFLKSLELAKRQAALGWQLRTATSLARLWRMQNRHDEAHAVLAPVFARFTEGFESSDLQAAREMLDQLENDVLIERRDASQH